ncbi:DNA-binding protein [Crocosphaera sp. XPORK-15E]|uniref:DNA-binding protein n=1 Tax=Crocosphaera sp. XPORK-15E TaxID=3110247 RepID=UPI002B2209BE|nr:DNA-binding protein [Crocosphaera sp. XPORK-15E]MEA5533847.1 DNA-binding protein [Crocosphaera sp. XPORK-15E]
MKILNIRGVHGGILSLLVGGLVGCTPLNYLGLAQTPLTPIREISPQTNPQTTPEAGIIYIEGKVVDRAPFMESGSYQLQDATGTVWVLTNGDLPQTGQEIIIKGKVAYQSIPIGGQDVGELYIVEVEKLDTPPVASSPVAQPVSSPQVKPTPQTNFDEFLLPHKRNAK